MQMMLKLKELELQQEKAKQDVVSPATNSESPDNKKKK
jgi:hypothetical protein